MKGQFYIGNSTVCVTGTNRINVVSEIGDNISPACKYWNNFGQVCKKIILNFNIISWSSSSTGWATAFGNFRPVDTSNYYGGFRFWYSANSSGGLQLQIHGQNYSLITTAYISTPGNYALTFEKNQEGYIYYTVKNRNTETIVVTDTLSIQNFESIGNNFTLRKMGMQNYQTITVNIISYNFYDENNTLLTQLTENDVTEQ